MSGFSQIPSQMGGISTMTGQFKKVQMLNSKVQNHQEQMEKQRAYKEAQAYKEKEAKKKKQEKKDKSMAAQNIVPRGKANKIKKMKEKYAD